MRRGIGPPGGLSCPLYHFVVPLVARAFGVRADSEYLEGGALAARRDERGYVRVDEHLRVVGETQTFALGDLADADRDAAGIANAHRDPARARGRSRPWPPDTRALLREGDQGRVGVLKLSRLRAVQEHGCCGCAGFFGAELVALGELEGGHEGAGEERP